MVGMTDYEDRDVDSLSGGQPQRVAIARAIVNEPAVLLSLIHILRPLTGDDIAEVVSFAAAVPEHLQLAAVLVMPANQATGTIVSRK